jgi:hypothetical protein
VIAAPPVRGYRSRSIRLRGIVAFVAATLFGALLTGLALFAVGQLVLQPPIQLVALVSVAAAIASTGLGPVRLPQLLWRVPRSWSRFGPTTFASLFGVILGIGVLTAISSPGYYVLVLWAIVSPAWSSVWPAFAAFGIGRAAPLALAALLSGEREGRLQVVVQQLRAVTGAVAYAETGMLVAVAVILVTS